MPTALGSFIVGDIVCTTVYPPAFQTNIAVDVYGATTTASGHPRILVGSRPVRVGVYIRDTLAVDSGTSKTAVARATPLLTPDSLTRMRHVRVQLAIVVENGRFLGGGHAR